MAVQNLRRAFVCQPSQKWTHRKRELQIPARGAVVPCYFLNHAKQGDRIGLQPSE